MSNLLYMVRTLHSVLTDILHSYIVIQCGALPSVHLSSFLFIVYTLHSISSSAFIQYFVEVKSERIQWKLNVYV